MLAAFGFPNVILATAAALAVCLVARRRVFGANERTATSWLDAWLKAFVIVVLVVFFTIYVPSYVVQTSTVSGMDGVARDLIGTTVWGVGMLAAMVTLRLAHKEKRV